jgi:uncharacterized protein (TIGR03437 family)
VPQPSRSLALLLWLSAGAHAYAQAVVTYANILGGSASNLPAAVTAGSDGSLYITGRTTSSDFPGAVRLSTSHNPAQGDLFVVKVDPTGAKIVYSAIVGAAQPVEIVLDAAGDAFVAGTQAASDFPVTAGAASAAGDCFVFKLDAAGDSLVYSTKLGCSTGETLSTGGLAVDAAGNAYLTGSGQITTTSGVYQTSGFGPFAMKVNPQGTALVYSTYLPGAAADTSSAAPVAVAVDASGNAYITGSADATTFPATVTGLPHEQPDPTDPSAITPDVFVVKLSADGTTVPFATIFGGYGTDVGLAIAPDADGFIYVAGASRTTTGFGALTPFPTTTGVIDTTAGFPQGFLTKLTPSGDAFVFSTFLPESQAANCISVQDAGVDVLTSELFPTLFPDVLGNLLMRVSLDGTTLIQSAIVSLMAGTYCGQVAGTFALTGSTGAYPTFPVITNPNLSPIGPAPSPSVWFSAIAADSPSSPVLNLSTGEFLLEGIPMPDGSHPPVNQTLVATTGSQNVPLSVLGNRFVSVSPADSVTPASITISAPQGAYADRLLLFAPGAQDGLAIIPISMATQAVAVTAQPLNFGGTVNLSATGPNAPPVSFTLLASSSVSDAIFGSSIAAPVNFTITPPSGGFPAWLSVSPMSGATPAQIQITANPSGLSAGFSGFCTFQLTWPQAPPAPFSVPGTLSVAVSFQLTQPVTPPPYLISTPDSLTFHLSSAVPTASATVHLASSGAPFNFVVGTLPTWLSVTPMSGTTPANINVTAAPGQITSAGVAPATVSINNPAGTQIGSFLVTADEVPAGYMGTLSVSPMSYPPQDTSPPFLAPGGLFYLALDPLLAPPAGTLMANPGPLPLSLGGYSFTLNGEAVPLQSYSGSFVAQVPVDITPGTYALNAFNTSGQQVATAQVQVVALAPFYIANSGLVRAQKADGSAITPANPVQPGDSILVELTGQGAVTPPLSSGAAASPAAPSTPVSPVSATIGGKPATVISNAMSTSQAGVLDLQLTVPNISAGDYDVSVSIGSIPANGPPIAAIPGNTLPIAVASQRLIPSIAAGGILNSASYVPAISPGSLFSIFGSGFGTAVATAAGFPLPTTIGQTSVTIGGKPAPLIYVSPVQINAQAPYELNVDPNTSVVVSVNGASSLAATVPVVAAVPAVFQYGQNLAVVQNQDYSLNGPGNGAAPGSYAFIYLTGVGQVDNPVETGSAALANPLSHVLGAVTVSIDGEPATVAFAGLTPGFAGLAQVNVKVPPLPPGPYFLLVSIDGNLSNSALLTVGP